jgi:hypothetical protein
MLPALFAMSNVPRLDAVEGARESALALGSTIPGAVVTVQRG